MPTDYLIVARKSGKTYDIVTSEPFGLQQSFSTQNNPLNIPSDLKNCPDVTTQPANQNKETYFSNLKIPKFQVPQL